MSEAWWEKLDMRNCHDRRTRQPDGTRQVIYVEDCEHYLDENGNVEYESNCQGIEAYNWAAAKRTARKAFGPGTLHILGAEEGPVSAYSSSAAEDFGEDDETITYWMCAWTQGKPTKQED